MTIYEKAKQLASAGMVEKDVFKFFSTTKRDVIEYIHLFGEFGVGQDAVWNLYEKWQES